MIPPTPGPDAASRLFGYATPPDGGPPIGPDQYWPQPSNMSFDDVLSALNPLQHVPVVGMIYRGVTGDEIPTPFKIGGAVISGAIFGGPIGVAGAALLGLITELIRMGPDRSRPPTPEGMSETGSEVAMAPVTPGSPMREHGYLTLATTTPEFLTSPDPSTQVADGLARYAGMSSEAAFTARMEKGIA